MKSNLFFAILVAASLVGSATANPRQLLESIGASHRPTIGDAVRVAALFADLSKGEDDAGTCHASLVKAGLLGTKDMNESNAPLTRGEACFIFARVLHLKGGWMARTFGLNPRYAYKELVSRGLMSEEGEGTPMTGEDLLGLFKLASVYRKRGRL